MRLLVLFLAVMVAAAAPQESTSGWMAMGTGAALTSGADGVVMSYELRPKLLSAALLPAPSAMARMQRMRVRVKSDHDTAVGVMLAEKAPGGRYIAYFWAPANTWQTVELTPADFAPSDGPTDPVDADGRLDVDQVQAVSILDLAQFFGALPENSDLPLVIDRPTGKHSLAWSDFRVLESAGPREAAGRIDDFDRGFLQWVTLGGMKLKLNAAENPLHMPALEATYPQAEGAMEVLLRRLSNLDLSKAGRLEFAIASEREATLIVSLEQKDGSRHNMTIYPPGGREVFPVNLKLADFEGSGKVDPSTLKSLTVMDITTAEGGAAGTNTIWIGKVGTGARAPE